MPKFTKLPLFVGLTLTLPQAVAAPLIELEQTSQIQIQPDSSYEGKTPGNAESLFFSPEPNEAPPANKAAFEQSVDKALKALKSANLDAAEAAFQEAIKLAPQAPGGYIGMAEVAAQRKRDIETQSWLTKAFEVDPYNVATLRLLANYQAQKGEFTEAEGLLQRASKIAPDRIDIQVALGQIQLSGLKNAKAAEDTFRSASFNNPHHLGARLGLAAALASQGRSDEALSGFEAAAQAFPDKPGPLLAMARYQVSLKKIDAALSTLDRLIAAQPSVGLAYLDRGDLMLLKNDVPNAVKAYQAMIKAAPESSAQAQLRLGSIFEAQQKWQEAEQAYRAAIKQSPKIIVAYNNLAFMYANRGVQIDEAKRLIAKAAELAPGLPAILDTQAWVQRAAGDLDSASKTLLKAIAAQPKNPAFHYHLGIIQSEQGLNKEASASFKQALEINAQFPQADDARERLGKL